MIAWGTVPEWVTVLGVVASFLLLYSQIPVFRAQIRELSDKVEDRERMQANKVAAWVEPLERGANKRKHVVSNQSGACIYDCEIWQIRPDWGSEYDEKPPFDRPHTRARSVIVPGPPVVWDVDVSGRGTDQLPRIGVLFRDNEDRWWWRNGDGHLHRTQTPPKRRD